MLFPTMLSSGLPAYGGMYQVADSNMFEDDDQRWKAVQTKDTSADGMFVFAVKTTKIYCRPVCKARLPRRANVLFFDIPSAAIHAGFRACKRCTPDAAGNMPEDRAVQKIKTFLTASDNAVTQPPDPATTLRRMSSQVGLSKWHFHRVFKKMTGLTPQQWLKLRRIDPALTSDLAASREPDQTVRLPTGTMLHLETESQFSLDEDSELPMLLPEQGCWPAFPWEDLVVLPTDDV